MVEDKCKVVRKGINANVSLDQSNDSEENSNDSKMIKTRVKVQMNNSKRER